MNTAITIQFSLSLLFITLSVLPLPLSLSLCLSPTIQSTLLSFPLYEVSVASRSLPNSTMMCEKVCRRKLSVPLYWSGWTIQTGAEQSWFPLLSGTSPKSANNPLDQLLPNTGRKHVLLIILNPTWHKTLHASKPKELDRCSHIPAESIWTPFSTECTVMHTIQVKWM